MRVKIKAFSLYRDLLDGRKEIEIRLDKESDSLEDILTQLSSSYPRLKKFLSKPENRELLLVFVNGERRNVKNTIIKDGDEIGLMAPPSGG